MLGLLPELVRVSGTGVLTEGAVPSGFIVAAPTSDRDTFILRPELDTEHPDWMEAPYTSFLWKVGDAKPIELLGSVVETRAAQTPALAWLADTSGAWWQVDAMGGLTKELQAAPLWPDEPSPTGQYVVEERGRSQGCDHDTPPSCRIRLIERNTGNEVALANVGSNSSFVWSGNSVAFIPTTSNPVDQPEATDIVLMSPGGVSLLPLPVAR